MRYSGKPVDTFEKLKEVGSNVAQGTAQELTSLLKKKPEIPWVETPKYSGPERRQKPQSVFSSEAKEGLSSREQQEIQQIKELLKQAQKEIEALKAANAALMREAKDVANLTINAPQQKSTYDLNFLEIVISLLQTLRAKVNESRTWLEVMAVRKAKRGSLFKQRKKTLGQDYTSSQELVMSRPGI